MTLSVGSAPPSIPLLRLDLNSDSNKSKKNYKELFLPQVILQTYIDWSRHDTQYAANLSALDKYRYGSNGLFQIYTNYSVEQILAKIPETKPIVDNLEAYERQYPEKLLKKIVNPKNIYTLVQAVLGGPEKFEEYSKYTPKNIFDDSHSYPVRVVPGEWPIIAIKCRVIKTSEIKYKCLIIALGMDGVMWVLKEKLKNEKDFSLIDVNILNDPKGAVQLDIFLKFYNLVHFGTEKFYNLSSQEHEEEQLVLAV